MSKKLEALIEDEKALLVPPPANVERGWQALAASVAAGVAPPFDALEVGQGASAAAGKAAALGGVMAAKAKLAVLALVAVAGAGVYALRSTDAPTPAALAPAPVHAPAAAQNPRSAAAPQASPALAGPELGSPELGSDVERSNPPAPTPMPSRAPASSPAPTSSSDTFEQELEVIRTAQAALARAKPVEALAALDEHQRRFPRGQFTEDRRALRALSLCASGRLDEGRRLAQAALRVAPRSLYVDRLRSACLTPAP